MPDVLEPNVLEMADVTFRWPGPSGLRKAPGFGIAVDRFSLAPREKLLLVGPSGSGKSTLLSLIAGIAAPQAGRISILGTDIARLSAAERDRFRAEHLGVIFQMFNLLPYGTVVDNVLLALSFARKRRERAGGQAGERQEAARLLSRLGLDDKLVAGRSAASLSVGQQQRVAAARALIGRPEIIVADEPTSALDAERQQAFIDLLLAESAAVGATLLFVSHDRRLAGHFDREVALAEINAARPPVRVAP